MTDFIDLTDAWKEWHEKCQLEKCSDENKSKFCNVAQRLSIQLIQAWKAKNPDKKSFLEDIFKHDNGEYAFTLAEDKLPDVGTPERRLKKEEYFGKAYTPGLMTGYFLEHKLEAIIDEDKNSLDNSKFEPFANNNIKPEFEDIIIHQKLKESPVQPQKYSLSPDIAYNYIKDDISEVWQNLPEVKKAALVVCASGKTMSDEQLLKHIDHLFRVKGSTFRGYPRQIGKTIMDKMSKNSFVQQYIDCESLFLRLFVDGLNDFSPDWLNNSTLGRWIKTHFEL